MATSTIPISYKSFTETVLADSQYTGATIRLRKFANGLVEIDVYGINLPAASNSNFNVSIPIEYRPNNIVYGVGINDNNVQRPYAVRTNGNITGYASSTTGLYFTAVYLANQYDN